MKANQDVLEAEQAKKNELEAMKASAQSIEVSMKEEKQRQDIMSNAEID